MKKISVLATAVLFTLLATAQHTIKGKITGEKNEALSGASITLKGKNKTTSVTAAENGEYLFSDLPNGSYEITITATGFITVLDNVVVNGTAVIAHYTLSPVAHQLQHVEVIGRSATRYNSDYSFSATKTATLIKDVPQSISTVTKELIADRQAFQLADAVKIISGVIPSSYYNQYAIRGISQNEEGQIINGMRTRQYYFIQPITSHIERIEVIKGPASVTFASVDPGGSINMVTKKPLAVDRKEISFTAGSFSTLRGTLDFTGPLNKEKTLLYRVNGAYQEAKSFRDLIRNNALLISPSISYIPNDKTSVNIEGIVSNYTGNLDRGQPIFGAVAGVTDLKSTAASLNLGAANDFFKSKEFILTATLSHRFTPGASFNATYMKQTWAEDLQEHRTSGAFAVDINNQPVTSLAAMQFIQRKQNWNIDNVSAYLVFDFATGKVAHKLLAGYDLHSWEKTKGGGQNAARGYLLTNGTVASSFVAANSSNYQTITYHGITLPKPNVTHFDLSNPVYTIRNTDDYILNSRTALPAALTTTNAVYIQEQLSFQKFKLLLSLRNEWFKDITNHKSPNELQFTNTVLLPRVGITYSATKHLNIYATYLKGFQPQANTVTLMPNTGSYYNTPKSASQFKPLESDLKEIGAKAELLKGKLFITAAYYHITQKNLLLSANVPAYPDSLATRGEERSRGFEIDATGFLLSNWQINLSYSYIDAIIVVDDNVDLIGKRKQNTPYHSYNLWTRYNFTSVRALRDIGIGFGLQHNGSRIPWFTRAFEVPAYTVFDMAVYYRPVNSHIQLGVNANNIFNKRYWIGAQNYLRLFPGAPRNILLTATYKF